MCFNQVFHVREMDSHMFGIQHMHEVNSQQASYGKYLTHSAAISLDGPNKCMNKCRLALRHCQATLLQLVLADRSPGDYGKLPA